MAVSRFRPDSEVRRLAAAAEQGDAWCIASPVFGAALAAGLRAAALTDSLVDPTVGAAVAHTGYDADLDIVRSREARTAADAPALREMPGVPGWRSVDYDPGTHRVAVRRGTVLDLGATAKAHAADTIASRLADWLPGGLLVNLGGDIAVAGRLPEAGWQIGVAGPMGVVQVVRGNGQAFATSSTRLRTWHQGERERHHIVDPRTGDTALGVWAQVTCAAASALEANAASTAAIVLGGAAPAWLEAHGIPARLEPADGGPPVSTPGWPRDERRSAA